MSGGGENDIEMFEDDDDEDEIVTLTNSEISRIQKSLLCALRVSFHGVVVVWTFVHNANGTDQILSKIAKAYHSLNGKVGLAALASCCSYSYPNTQSNQF